MQRLRLRYAKRGRARFASHRDFGRAFERALRRAEIPMAFSSGFNPHPRISYLNAAPTGAASESEYVELGLSQRCDPEQVRAALNAAMPAGLVIVAAVEATGGSLAAELTASRWLIEWPQADAEQLAMGVAELLAASNCPIQRQAKSGLRTFDVRPAVLELKVVPAGLELVGTIGEPLLRPGDVVAALKQLRPQLAESGTALFSRREQGPWDGHQIGDPLSR